MSNEQVVIQLLTGLGVPGVGFVFLWVMMQRFGKLVDRIVDNLDRKVDAVDTKMGDLRTGQLLTQKTFEHIDNENTSQTSLLRDIDKGIDELVGRNNRVPFEQVALARGMLTPDDVRDLKRDQRAMQEAMKAPPLE